MSTSARSLVPRFVVSSAAHQADNRSQRNHWSAYIPEVCDQLGLKAEPLEVDAITPGTLSGASTVLLPAPAGEWLDSAARAGLRQWVHDGGLLVGLGTMGLDSLFGVSPRGEGLQQLDDFSAAAALRYTDHALTAGAHWPLHPEAPGPVLAPVRVCEATEAETLAEAR